MFSGSGRKANMSLKIEGDFRPEDLMGLSDVELLERLGSLDKQALLLVIANIIRSTEEESHFVEKQLLASTELTDEELSNVEEIVDGLLLEKNYETKDEALSYRNKAVKGVKDSLRKEKLLNLNLTEEEWRQLYAYLASESWSESNHFYASLARLIQSEKLSK